METLHTPRLVLRSFEPEDLEDFYAYAQDPEVGPRAGWKPHANRQETEKILGGFIRDGEVWALWHREDKKVIGSLGLHRDAARSVEDVRMLGYVLARPYWGQGLMPEAAEAAMDYGFARLGLALISVAHFPFNAASRRVIEKCGFSYEGTRRHALRRYDGMVLDECCYSMTREEWQALRGSDGPGKG